ETDTAVRRALLTFAVAGGGFAGVETIGAINDLVRDSLRYYPRISRDDVRFLLIFPGDLVLPELDEPLRHYAQRKLIDRGVEVLPNSRVAGCNGTSIALSSGQSIPSATLIWTAGVTPNPVVATLPCAKDHGRIVVDNNLAVADCPGIWAV